MNQAELSISITSFRPTTIGEVIGIDHLLHLLSSWEEQPESIPPAIMLHGPFGTGKTTLARIIASLAGAHGPDIKEVNAGDDRKIDDVRALLDQTRFKPLSSPKRVFIIDEFHGYISHAQTALLKALEEPPPCNMFILVTSDPIKVLPQIRSRCISLETRPLPKEATRTLVRIASKGALNLSPEAAACLWRSSGGHARDLLKLTAKHLGLLLQGELPPEMEVHGADWDRLIDSMLSNPQRGGVEHLRAASRPGMSPYEVAIFDDSLERAILTGNTQVVKSWPAILSMRTLFRQNLLHPKEYIMGVLCLLNS